MNKRPRLKLQLTSSDKALEMLGWISIISIWALAMTNYQNLPDIIPIHYNGAGQADGFGGKGNILALPFIATIIFVELTIINKFPHIFNYPTTITADNALRQYTNATKMVRVLKLIIVVVFGFIVLQTIRNVKGETTGLGTWFLPLVIAMIFIPIIYFIIRSFKSKVNET